MYAGLDPAAVIFTVGLIFARIGAIVMLLPGFGEPWVPPRIRLSFALAFAFAAGPMLAGQLPAMPDTAGALAGLVALEALIGLMIGVATRFLLAAGAVAGQVIGYQAGLAMAQSFNLVFMLLIFATNLHHLLLRAAAGSYEMMPAGSPPMFEDAAYWALGLFIDAFVIGVQIASPLIVFGLMFYLGLGVLSRLMPQAQIFFIAMPLNILVGFSILAMSLGAMALVWLERFERFAVTLQ